MIGIPDDVLTAAKEAAYFTETTGDDEAAITSFVGVRVICGAILAERKRCADVAEARAEWVPLKAGDMRAAIEAGA